MNVVLGLVAQPGGDGQVGAETVVVLNECADIQLADILHGYAGALCVLGGAEAGILNCLNRLALGEAPLHFGVSIDRIEKVTAEEIAGGFIGDIFLTQPPAGLNVVEAVGRGDDFVKFILLVEVVIGSKGCAAGGE